MKQLSGLDAMFLYWEAKGASMHTAMIHVYDPATAAEGQVDFDTVREHLRRCLPISDMFRQRLTTVPGNFDHPYWIRDPDFNLDNHISKVTLAEPSWEAFCALIAKQHERPLDRNQPLWELIYIDGLGGVRDFPPGAFALMLKMHHAAVDGASSAGIIAGLHDLTSDAAPKNFTDDFVAEPAPSTAGLMLRGVVNNLRAPARLAGPAQRMLPGLARSLRSSKGGARSSRRGPMTRFNRRVNAERIYDAREYPLAELSAIRKAVPGATVNDVILALASGGIREYLIAHDELPAESLIGMVPVSTRDPNATAGGNEVTLMMLPLHTEIADPLERLTAIASESDKAKQTVQAVGARELTALNKAAPATMMAMSFRLVTAANLIGRLRAFNTVVSNVPGPREPVYLCGAKLVSWSGMGPCSHGIGFGFPVLSYNGKVNFAFSGCSDAMPDPAFAADCLDNAYTALKAAASHKSSLSKRKKHV